MTPRSLVGMTMGARRRRLWNEFFDEAWDGATIDDFRTEAAKYRIGQRLRPCPGCAECGHTPTVKLWKLSRNALWVSGRLGVRNIKHICNGSGVLPARAKKVRR